MGSYLSLSSLSNAPDVFPRRPLSRPPQSLSQRGYKARGALLVFPACVVDTIILHYEDAKARFFACKTLTLCRRCGIILSVLIDIVLCQVSRAVGSANFDRPFLVLNCGLFTCCRSAFLRRRLFLSLRLWITERRARRPLAAQSRFCLNSRVFATLRARIHARQRRGVFRP